MASHPQKFFRFFFSVTYATNDQRQNPLLKANLTISARLSLEGLEGLEDLGISSLGVGTPPTRPPLAPSGAMGTKGGQKISAFLTSDQRQPPRGLPGAVCRKLSFPRYYYVIGA